MSQQAQASGWKSTIDISKDDWVLDVVRCCPYLNFPPEWITAFEEERFVNLKKLWRGEIQYDFENPDSIVATPEGMGRKPLTSTYVKGES